MIDYRIHRTVIGARGQNIGAFTVIDAGVVIEEGVAIGPLCYIGPNVTLGKGASIGAGAIVLTDVPEGTTIDAGAVWKAKAKAEKSRE